MANSRTKSSSCDVMSRVRPDDVSAHSVSPRSRRRTGSSEAVGSSISRSGGSIASARAIATRCASPPEISRGNASARCATPSSSRSRPRLRDRLGRAPAAARAPARARRSGPLTDARTGSGAGIPCRPGRGARESSRPGWRRHAASSRLCRPTIDPPSNGSSAAMARRIVVLPSPDSPISATSSPRFTCSVIERRTSRAPRRSFRPLTSRITGAFMPPSPPSTGARAAGRSAPAAAT